MFVLDLILHPDVQVVSVVRGAFLQPILVHVSCTYSLGRQTWPCLGPSLMGHSAGGTLVLLVLGIVKVPQGTLVPTYKRTAGAGPQCWEDPPLD